jgi:hypothetical protein
MDPVTGVLIPGFIGGLLIALVVLRLQRRDTRTSVAAPYRPDPISTDIINMSSIKVAGVGGLGLVAMAAAVALDVPRIAQSVGIGIGLGAIGALIVILRRRRTGPMPSSGQGLGANTTLAIDVPQPPDQRPDRDLRLVPALKTRPTFPSV